MKEPWSTVRNVAFLAHLAAAAVMGAFFLGIFRLRGMSFGQNYDVLAVGFGACGLAVFLLTLGVKERWLQKGFFLLAGAAGTGVLVTMAATFLLKWSGHAPGGDGGGIIVPMLVGCPIAFLVGAVGALVCLARGARGERKAASPVTPPTESP